MNLLKISLDIAGKTLECVNKWMPGQLVDVALDRDVGYLECATHGGRCDCDATTPGCTKFGDAYDPLTPKMRDDGWEYTPFDEGRKPRVAVNLGAAERNAEWLDPGGARYRWASANGYPPQWWWCRSPASGFYTPTGHRFISPIRGPFTAIWTGADLDWLSWAIPAIKTVLDQHFPQQCPSGYDCNPGTEACPLWPDEQGWREHVAPLIAKAIGVDPERAADALSRYKPDKVHV